MNCQGAPISYEIGVYFMGKRPCTCSCYMSGRATAELFCAYLISHLDHKMKETNLHKNYSMQQLLDKLDVLECFKYENRKLRIGELLNKQAEIYETLGVILPTSSC